MYKAYEKLRQKPMIIFGLCLLALIPLSFFIVYYFRVIHEPAWLNQTAFSIYVFAALAVLFSICFFLLQNYKKKPELVLATLVFIIAALFALTTPVNQVPDENVHFLRAQAMAQGQFGFDENHEFPRDTMVLMESFPNMYLNGYSYSIASHYEMYFENVADAQHTPPQIGIIIFQFFAYIPQTIGIVFARIIGCGAMGAFYFSRIFNALFFSVCAYFSFVFAKRFKILIFTVMLIPILIYSAGSANSDSVLFALMFVALSAVLSENFNLKKLAVFTVCMAILIVSKASYVVLLPLIFAVNRENWNVSFKLKKISKKIAAAFAVVFSVFIYQFMAVYVELFSNYGVIERTMDSTNPAMQLMFILQNPLRYIATFADLMIEQSFFLFQSGLLGWLDADIVIVSNFTVIFVLINTFKQSHVFKKKDFSIVLGFAIASLLTYGVVVTGLYLSWSPVGHIDIIGVQMRYFAPAFVGAVLVLGYYLSRFTSAHGIVAVGNGNCANNEGTAFKAPATSKKNATNETITVQAAQKTSDISCIALMLILNVFAAIMNVSLYYVM